MLPTRVSSLIRSVFLNPPATRKTSVFKFAKAETLLGLLVTIFLFVKSDIKTTLVPIVSGFDLWCLK